MHGLGRHRCCTHLWNRRLRQFVTITTLETWQSWSHSQASLAPELVPCCSHFLLSHSSGPPLSSPQPALYSPSTPTLSPEPGFPLISSRMPAPSTLVAVDWPTLVPLMLMYSIVGLCLRQSCRPCLACPRSHSEHSRAACPLPNPLSAIPDQGISPVAF